MASGHGVPHQQAGHMAAPTSLASPSKKTLAKAEPSTHGTKRAWAWWRDPAFGPARRLVAALHPRHAGMPERVRQRRFEFDRFPAAERIEMLE
jgi:hypothetical protein